MAGGDVGRLVERRVGQRSMVRTVGQPIKVELPGRVLARDPLPITALRTTDLLLVRFSFQNLKWIQVDGAQALARRSANQPALLIADFPPQHLIEEAFSEKVSEKLVHPPEPPFGSKQKVPIPTNDDVPPTPPPIHASLSAHSRLVFKVGSETIRWSLDGLLDAMTRLPLSVAPHADNPIRVLVPIDRRIVDAVTTADQLRALTANPDAVAAVVQSVGRAAAAARTLDHRLGAGTSAEITSNSRIATQLGISADVVGRLPSPVRRPAPRPPTATETAIELPWRLQISPHSEGGFTHASEPVEHDGRVELWHSRLGCRVTDAGDTHVDDTVARGRTVRAIWARDIEGPLAPTEFDAMGRFDTPFPQFTKSLTSRDRRMLVHETSDFTLTRPDGQPWNPPAVDVERLMLTALGGWLCSEFNATTLPIRDFSITEWKHRATMGRDHEVKVVYAGFLYPLRHPASLVKVTERKIQTLPSLPGRYAYLRQRFYLIVRQQTMTYPSQPPMWVRSPENAGGGIKRLDLAMPFSSISILTKITPDLDPPSQEPEAGAGPFCFFPSVDGTPFLFKMLATDREDQMVEYSGPLMFIERGRNVSVDSLERVATTYWDTPYSKRKQDLGGQRVAFAQSVDSSGAPLDTTLAVDTLSFDGALPDDVTKDKQDQAQFWPILRTADVVVPAMNALAGVADTTRMKQPSKYLENGWVNNAAHVFLQLEDGVKPAIMSFAGQADRSGGFATPSLAVTGLSGSKGPIGGPIDDAIDGTMDPERYFGGLDLPAKLFGAIPLSKLLAEVGLTPDNMPSFVAKSINKVTGFLDGLARINTIATDVGRRYGDAADAGIQTLSALLNTAQTRAQAVLAAFADISTHPDAEAAITQLADALGNLTDRIDATTALPAALRVELSAVAHRLTDYAADTDDIVSAATTLLGGATLPETVTAKLSWSTKLAPWPKNTPLFQPRPTPGHPDGDARATLDLSVEVEAATRTGPTTTLVCSITPFSLRLLGEHPFIELFIEAIEFTVIPGHKPDVNIVLGEPGVKFGGPLLFVNALRDLIPLDHFSDPPYLDVDAQGIRAGFDLALPDIPLGVMSLSNVSLAAQANIPFIGDSLDFTFGFCTRENPFRLTVWLFGGGGFFGITVTPSCCRMLEAAFEFGAAAAVDFAVASGSVECMAGIYFKLENTPAGDNGQLAGYFRMRGEVDVLGLISASIELYLELTYELGTNTAAGRASLAIEVEVALLSTSVTLTCEKKFKGSDNDPTFEQMLGLTSPDGRRAWDEYCDAFAAS